MSDLETQKTVMTTDADGDLSALKGLTQIIYLLYALGFVVGLTPLVAIVMSYLKRPEARGTWLDSHFDWQIQTFWYALVGFLVSLVLVYVVIGMPLMFAVVVWYIYRIVKGWLRLTEGMPVS